MPPNRSLRTSTSHLLIVSRMSAGRPFAGEPSGSVRSGASFPNPSDEIRCGWKRSSGILNRSTPISMTFPSGSSYDTAGMFWLSSSENVWSDSRNTVSFRSAAISRCLNSRYPALVFGHFTSDIVNDSPSPLGARLNSYLGRTGVFLLFSRYSSTMSVMASPPSGDRVAALVNAYPSCTALTVVPPPPQSTTSAVARPVANAARHGFFARKIAGGLCFSKRSSTIFSRFSRVVCAGSPIKIGCSLGSTTRRFFSVCSQMASTTSQSSRRPFSSNGEHISMPSRR
mmetsp:Transcript_7311/g.26762  ORF Transcript_7311/g.26762 Transcript_7311/m.26762 type:complete len:284 (+) Transcript_7311:314-1165(+)